MDDTDFDLLARLSAEPLASVSSLARAVGLSPNAVRARLSRLKAARVYDGTIAIPNPRVLGRVGKLAIYAPPPRAVDGARILAVDDVLGFSLNHDGQVAVTWLARSPDEPPPAALDALLGGPAPRVVARDEPEVHPRGAVLSAREWRLVEAMMEDARQTQRALAAASGMGERAVARAVERLVAGRFVMLYTIVMPNMADGIVPFHLWVHGAATRDERMIREALRWCVVEDRIAEPPGLFIFCRAQTLGDALAARDRVARIPGVDHAEIVLQSEQAVAWERLHAMARERAALGRVAS